MSLYFFYTMVQKSQRGPKTQFKGWSCLKTTGVHCNGGHETCFAYVPKSPGLSGKMVVGIAKARFRKKWGELAEVRKKWGTKKAHEKKDHEERIFYQKKSTFGFRGEGKLVESLEKEKGRSNKNINSWGGGVFERRQFDRAQQGLVADLTVHRRRTPPIFCRHMPWMTFPTLCWQPPRQRPWMAMD